MKLCVSSPIPSPNHRFLNLAPRTFLPRKGGFALITTVSILVLLALVAVGLLSLSTVTVRAASKGDAQSEARSNAKLALILAIGDLQKTLGPDQRISAPAGILDSSPDSPSIDGVDHPFLTGVWQGRRESLEATPDYSRQSSFLQWLVSHGEPRDLEDLNFATSSSRDDRVVLVDAPSSKPADQVFADKVELDGGAYAWWIGDENCKARINRRDLPDREGGASMAELLAGFATPGAHGLQAVDGFESYPTNTEDTDKLVTLRTMELNPPSGDTPAELFHDLSPYSESLLTNVASGGLRKDLSLYLEREDIEWDSPWGRAQGVRRGPNGPEGPNGEIALSPPDQYDVLAWKSLHHWYHMHRQVSRSMTMNALSGVSATDPVSNPTWNSGVAMPTPIVARMQMLISYGVRRVGAATSNTWDLKIYSYPVVTLWNPYNVVLNVPEYSIFLHTVPLEHAIYVNDAIVKRFNWQWTNTEGDSGNMVMRLTSPLTLMPGEAKTLNYTTSRSSDFTAHDMAPLSRPYTPTHAGQERQIARLNDVSSADTISIETRASRWETSGTSYAGQNFQTTFGFRCEPKNVHVGHGERFLRQMFSGQVCWRRERSNPSAADLSETNFPSQTVGSVLDAPTPFLHLDVRLKTADEAQLPNKTWSHCIPSLSYAAATSTTKHSGRGVDSHTTFFAHPYTISFEQKTTPEGLFQSVPYIGSSNTPAGQTFVTDCEVPMAPLTSLGQLQNLPQYPMEALNWSGYYFQNHAIGNSFASPGVPSDEVKVDSFPFYLGQYLAWQGGDITGRTYPDTAAFNGADYEIAVAPAAVIDRSYAANHLLWDDYFFSSMAAQDSLAYSSFGSQSTLDGVLREFFEGTKPLPNTSYLPNLGTEAEVDEVIAELLNSSGGVTEDAHLKAAARLRVEGGFNINSTSVPAWAAMLASAHLKRAVILEGSGRRASPEEQGPAAFVVSRFTMPNGPAATGSAADEDLRWRGYRELTADEIRELAEAVVQQVKERGPFRSLGEFVNRRLGPSSDETSLYGALQAALEDSDVSINAEYRSSQITEGDIADANYKFKEAALGSRFQGAPGYVTQADLLTNMAPIINARSDTFVVRAYGESRADDGEIQARAWCEAVVQRKVEYLDPTDEPDTAADDLDSEVNRLFGRQLKLHSFRWLSQSEVEMSA